MDRNERVLELLGRSLLFGALDAAQRVAVAQEMRDLVLEAGQTLFSRGDSGDQVYLVEEGRVRFSVLSADGRELSFSHALAGDVFGEIAALDGGPRSADATAITPVRLKTLSQSAFRRLLNNRSEVALALAKLVCTRLREVSEHFEAISLHPIEVRLARLLLDMLQEQRKPLTKDGTASIVPGMTQSELALLMGATRQRANAALRFLERNGAITRSKRSVECNIAKLRQVAQRS